MIYQAAITVSMIDEEGNTLSTQEISKKEITAPTDSSNFGYSRIEQLAIMGDIQQAILDKQAIFLNQRPDNCPICHSNVWSAGSSNTSFEHVFSSHKISMQVWRCSNKDCKWNNTSSLTQQLSGTMHIDLIKLQVECGANNSYRKAAKELTRVTGKRTINNHGRIRCITKAAGSALADRHPKEDTQATKPAPVKELYAAVDGGHIHEANNPGHNFEAMMGKIYSPNNVVRLDKHHTKIIKKHCAGSGKSDEQETMKTNIIEAAKKEGIDKGKTVLTAFADGAKNCWNIISTLSQHCLAIICILDWFHVGKYICRIKKNLPHFKEQLDAIHELLWHGCVKAALGKIQALSAGITDEKQLKLINNFYEYIFSNKEYIVNYDRRKNAGIPYTSHVAESTVEHVLNDRCKRKQKMQWSRERLHAVIQIRVSQASGDWDDDWENVIAPKLQAAA